MLGLATIFLAFIATCVAIIFYLKASVLDSAPYTNNRACGKAENEKKGTLFYGIATSMIFLAVGYLYYLIFSDNFRYAYVVGYSSRDQALAYKFSAFWAGQEGSFLLWAFFHAVFGLLLTRKNAAVAMATHCGLQLFLLLVLLVKSPFQVLVELHPDGMGLNPLLQNPWMVIHPPVVFLGYAALAIPFAWAIHGLLTGRHKIAVNEALPWTLFAWASLGAGIFIGGFWAYKVLGWGGYWSWDPVENSSLVPWLVTGGLLHLLLLARVRQTAVRLVYLTAISNFVLVLYGTFLTRSGVLSNFSNHSFSDEGIGGLLASFVLLTAAGGLIALVWRWSKLPDSDLFLAIKSREFCLGVAAMLLAALSIIVIIGMSTPLVTMLSETPYSVSASFYNAASLPLVTGMLVLLTWGIFWLWGENQGGLFRKRGWLLVIALGAAAPALVLGIRNPFALAVAGLAVAAIVAAVLAMRDKILSWPAGLTHVGVAITLIGIIFSSLAGYSVTTSFANGERQEFLGTGITYLGKQADADGQGFYQLFALDDPPGAMLLPYTSQKGEDGPAVNEPGIYHRLMADIYLAPVVHQESGEELDLRKDEQVSAAGVGVHFIRFIMDEGDKSGQSTAKAYALLEVTQDDGTVQSVKPGLVSQNGQVTPIPVKAFNRYEITLTAININDGKAGIVLRDLTPSPKPDRVEVEISRKPLISLVWLGAILITFGIGWAAYKRCRKVAGQEL
jgi:cytochrome c-type biogenesis protein CcmF